MIISDDAYHICHPLSNTLIFLQANTYQAVLITNLETFYALFKYDCNSIQWTGRFTFPTIGFNSLSTSSFINHPSTGQSNANNIVCKDRNLLYEISASQSLMEKRIWVEWYSTDK